MAALSLMPIWVFMYVRSRHRAAGGRHGPARRSAPRSTATARAATARPARVASAGRSPTARSSRRSRTSRTSCGSSTSARPSTTSPASRSTATPTARAARTRPARSAPMPAWGATAGGELTDDEILAVVCHERYTLGGADPTSDEYAEEFDDWCSEDRRSSPPWRPAPRSPTSPTPGLTDADGRPDRRSSPSATTRSPDRRPADVTATVDAAASAGPRPTITTDVLVVGGGPAGAAAGYWLARHGHDVTVVEKQAFPREKTCGDGLTPRAVKQLADMGLGGELERFHRYHGPAGHRDGPAARAGVAARTRVYPQLRLRRAPARARRRSSPPTPSAPGATLLAGPRGGAPDRRAGLRRAAPRSPAPTARAARRAAPSSRSSPTAPTAASAARSARPARGSGRTARRSARTGSRRGTPSRGSSRRSTSRTATATRCPATAGSSRSATAR